MATNPNFKFRRGFGFRKACQWLLGLWLVALSWSFLLNNPPKHNFAILISAWCLMALFFLQQKTVVNAQFEDAKTQDTLLLDKHRVPVSWSQFIWCRKNEPTLFGNYRTSLVAYQRIENQKMGRLSLVLEQSLNRKIRGLFVHLPVAPHFDAKSTFFYLAIGQSLINVVNITDPEFLDVILLNETKN